jgi:hypothetical protein
MGKGGFLPALDQQKVAPFQPRLGQRATLLRLSKITGCSIAELLREAIDDLAAKLSKENQ